MEDKALLDSVADYYTEKLKLHGATPSGSDWNSAESQVLRFDRLCKVITQEYGFSINDLGCGYGALLDYLKSYYSQFRYIGTDISLQMIEAARKRYAEFSDASFIVRKRPDSVADYSLASGIFNVRLKADDEAWLAHIYRTLDALHEHSRYGFSFNCLTSYSDTEKMRDYLYYADPCKIFDYCKRNYSRNVALLHDYGLYEFTILVRKAA